MVRVALQGAAVVGHRRLLVAQPLQHPPPPEVGLGAVRLDLGPEGERGVGRLVPQPEDVRPGHGLQDGRGVRVVLLVLDDVHQFGGEFVHLAGLDPQEEELQLHGLGRPALQLETAVQVRLGGSDVADQPGSPGGEEVDLGASRPDPQAEAEAVPGLRELLGGDGGLGRVPLADGVPPRAEPRAGHEDEGQQPRPQRVEADVCPDADGEAEDLSEKAGHQRTSSAVPVRGVVGRPGPNGRAPGSGYRTRRPGEKAADPGLPRLYPGSGGVQFGRPHAISDSSTQGP